MDNTYSNSYASLHTVKHDTTILDAQKILIRTPEDSVASRTDLIEYIDKKGNEHNDKVVQLKEMLSEYTTGTTYTPYTEGRGINNILAFVTPANIYPSDKLFNNVIIICAANDVSPYLGLIAQDLSGNKTVIGVSDAPASIGSGTHNPVAWTFKKPFNVPENVKLYGIFLKSNEGFTTSPTAEMAVPVNVTINSNTGGYPDNPYGDPTEGYYFVDGLSVGAHEWEGNVCLSLTENRHIDNSTHLTPEQYQKLENLNLSDIPSIDNLVTKDNPDWLEIKQQIILGTLKEKYYTTNLENRTNATTACNIKIDDTHFVPGGSVISNIGLAYSEGDHSGFSTPHWCHIYPYDSNNTLIGNAIISTTTATRPADNEGVTTWEFAGDMTSRLPENYDYIVIKVSGTDTPHPNADGTQIRISVANINGTSSHSSFGDKCAVTGGQGPGPYLGVVNVNYLEADKTLLERIEVLENIDYNDININISELEETVASHTSSIQSMGVSIADHTTTIGEHETTIGEHTTTINTHTEEIAEIKEKLEGVTKTEQFSNLTGANEVCSAHSIQLSKEHFIKPGSVITKLYLPYKENDAAIQNQYSHIQFFDENETLISQFDSEDTQSREGSATGISVWTYIDVEVPEYRYVRFTLSGSKTDRPDGQRGQNCTMYRINVVKQDSGIQFDNDDCEIWNRGTKNNWVGEVKVDYTYVENLNNTIIEIKNSVTELESKNYAYTDTENTFVETIKFEKDVTANTVLSPDIHADTLSANNKLYVGREYLTSGELDEIKGIVLGKESVVVSNTENTNAIYQVVCARIENPFFASGTISNVRIFHNIDHTGLFDKTPRYLYLNVDGSVYRSHAVVYDSPVSYSDFRFDNINIPDNYRFVDVLMSINPELENPSWSNYSGTINFSAAVAFGGTTYGASAVRIPNGVGNQSAIIKLEITTGVTTGTTLIDRINSVVGGTYLTEASAREIFVDKTTNEQTLADITGDITDINGSITDINGDITNINEAISGINTSIGELKDADITINQRIDALEGADVTINERIDYLGEQLRDNIQNEITENLVGKDVDLVFDSNDLGVGNDDYSHNDAANIKCARVSKAHFIKPGCMVKSITIPYKNSGFSWTNQWLHIQYYDSAGTKIIQHTSNNQQSFTAASDNTYYEATWTFDDGLYAPTNYAYIHINVSGGANDVPTTTENCTPFRASIVRNANNQTFDDDECHVWLENGSNGNHLLHYKVAYVERVDALPQLDSIINNALSEVLNGFSEYSFKVTPKYDGDALSHFDISSGNVYLENKQIVQIPAKNDLHMNSTLGESQYVVLNVFNNPNGTISYSYNAVNEDELIELGYTIVTPVEETIDLSN